MESKKMISQNLSQVMSCFAFLYHKSYQVENWNMKQFLVDMYKRNLNIKLLRPFEATMIRKPTERSIWKLLKVNGGSRTETAHFWSTVPWLLTKPFEKSDFCWKVSKMHTFSVSTHQKVQNVHFFNFFPRKNPLGVLKIEVYPMGKWISFLMSACLPDSNTVEILKIWQIFNSLPYLHMGLRDLSSTP